MKNIKIGTQLIFGFAALLLFVIIIGVVSYLQSNEIYRQTETMYDHPLKVRRAIGNFKADIYAIQCDMKDLFLTQDEKEIAIDLNKIETWKARAFEQIDILYNTYLGPRNDIDSLKQAYINWNSSGEETIRLLREGNIHEAADHTKTFGNGGNQIDVVLAALQKIDNFAEKKGDLLFAESKKLLNSLNSHLFLLIALILLLSLIITFILVRNIRKPLTELAGATRRFHEGDMSTRSSYALQNEFGVLSASFNTMVEGIQVNTDLNEKLASLAGLMLSKYDAKEFFQQTINALALHTGSQLAAVYLLSDNKKTFEHFESIGVDDNARQSFSADRFEGEFGAVLSSRKIQHIKNIPEDTRFVFHTVSGKFIPHEIVTLPILADNEVVAIISLASISRYSKQSLQLIDRILVTLCARVEGILAYHKMKELTEMLEHQNHELESQKTEMTAQSAELMQQNTELETQKKQLGEASRLKTNFLSNMSHELRTPLNSIIALSGVLNRHLANQIPKEEYSYLEVIERNGKHLLSLINDILDISRIEAGHEEIEITRFNVNNLIAEVVTMIHPQAEQKSIELLHSDKDSDLSISSDVAKCRHIIQNLIINAVKFTEKGKVNITALNCDNHITIAISDTGIGISETHLPYIFDEFRQADGSTSRRFGGSGLGLAIAKKYANLLGGTISVISEIGKGSEFTLSLPLSFTPENRIIDTERTIGFEYQFNQKQFKPLSGAGVKTILLVEDSEPAIIQIKDILEESVYKILIAHDGVEAFEIIAKSIPDAVILDLMMPGIDGFEVLKMLREAEPTANLPVLILTAKHITKEELKFLKRNNVHQLIQKGDVNRNDLLNMVSSMVFPEPLPAIKPKRELQSIEGKPVVLAVEDNFDNMLTVRALLADDYTVLEAVNGKEAVETAKKYLPNLILMDIALPEMDGIEALKTIRLDGRLHHIPVIALTASAMVNDRETVLAHGFDAYISKPIDEIIFFKTINDVLYGK